MSETIRVLTISQPFAALITSGKKVIENRTWETLQPGPLAIHAGKGSQYLNRDELRGYPTGCIVAFADLIGCIHIEALREAARTLRVPLYLQMRGLNSKDVRAFSAHEHAEGPFCWLLRNVRPLREPFRINGKQGLWTWDVPDLIELLDPVSSILTPDP